MNVINNRIPTDEAGMSDCSVKNVLPSITAAADETVNPR